MTASEQCALREASPPWLPVGLEAPDQARATLANLTAGQHRVANLIACGLTDRQIARALAISQGTVNQHCKVIYSRLELPRVLVAVVVHLAHQSHCETCHA